MNDDQIKELSQIIKAEVMQDILSSGKDPSEAIASILRSIPQVVSEYIKNPDEKMILDWRYGMVRVYEDGENIIIRMYDFEEHQSVGYAFSPLQAELFIAGIKKMIGRVG